MPAAPRTTHPAKVQVQAELAALTASVAGVTGALAATSDGFLVAGDACGLEPTQVAALVAALHSVASRAVLTTVQGQFREAVIRSSDGYLVIYSAGHNTIVAITGTGRLNVGMLQYQARDIVERIAAQSAEFDKVPAPPGPKPAAAAERARTDRSRALPVRRRTAS